MAIVAQRIITLESGKEVQIGYDDVLDVYRMRFEGGPIYDLTECDCDTVRKTVDLLSRLRGVMAKFD